MTTTTPTIDPLRLHRLDDHPRIREAVVALADAEDAYATQEARTQEAEHRRTAFEAAQGARPDLAGLQAQTQAVEQAHSLLRVRAHHVTAMRAALEDVREAVADEVSAALRMRHKQHIREMAEHLKAARAASDAAALLEDESRRLFRSRHPYGGSPRHLPLAAWRRGVRVATSRRQGATRESLRHMAGLHHGPARQPLTPDLLGRCGGRQAWCVARALRLMNCIGQPAPLRGVSDVRDDDLRALDHATPRPCGRALASARSTAGHGGHLLCVVHATGPAALAH